MCNLIKKRSVALASSFLVLVFAVNGVKASEPLAKEGSALTVTAGGLASAVAPAAAVSSVREKSPVVAAPSVDTTRSDREVGLGSRRLNGQVSINAQVPLVGQRIDELLDAALARDPNTAVLDKAVKHYRGLPARVWANSKDAANFVVPYRGFAPSSEAGDIITSEKLKVNGRSAAEYIRQKQIDETHLKVVNSVMQMAMALGMQDQTRGQQLVTRELMSLRELVGEAEADKTLLMLATWNHQISIPDSAYKQPEWDVNQRRGKFSTIAMSALKSDPVVIQIENCVHKYNHRSKFARASGHFFETFFGLASLGPDFIGAVGEVCLVSFVMATGGPEQAKVMKELYLDKRLDSRCKVVNEETHLALENYQLGLLTHNPLLVACSESLVQQMAGPEAVAACFGGSLIAGGGETVPQAGQIGLAAGPAGELK